MEKRPRNKWVLALLTLSVLAFVSISIIPLVGGLLNPPASSSSQPNAPVVSEQGKLLEDQEKGYKSVVDREPNNETALRGLFETRAQLIRIGKRTPEDLIDPLEKLRAINPEQTDIAVLLAQTHEQVGDREAAAQTYRDVLDQSPGDINALQGLVSLFVQENQSASAVELLRSTLAANQSESSDTFDKSAVQILLGDVYASQGSFDQALELYDQLLAESPSDYRPMVGKALALKKQGSASDAQVWFDKAASSAPAQFKEQIQQLAQQPLELGESDPPTDTP
ncbi:MAG: tetratricopeptide repeat protein [Cyanobacteria bacterium P01_F01_bin.42]